MSSKPRDFLERPGHIRFQLQRDIAEGKLSPKELREKYGASAAGIRSFELRHKATIEAMRADIDNEFAGLWIAEKRQRVAAYERNAALIAAEIEALADGRVTVHGESDGDGSTDEAEDGAASVDDVSGAIGRLTRAYDRALRSVAEELGQLPTRMVVKSEGGGAVHVYGAGVDTDKV